MAVSPYEDLYKGAQAARENLSRQWFPKYSQSYLESQSGVKKWMIQTCNQIHTVSSTISHKISLVFRTIFDHLPNFSDTFILKYPKKIYHYVFPVNPVHQRRQCFRYIDKFLGDYIFYPMHTLGERSSMELLPTSFGAPRTTVSQPVNQVMKKVLGQNKGLLNPEGQTEFNYKVMTIASSQVNAFCLPGGGMIVCSQIVKELYGAIETNQIKQAEVSLPDGGKATIDLSGVRLEDALAALMGHEMTHAAARHSIVAILVNKIISLVRFIFQLVCVQYMKSKDPEYKHLAMQKNSLSEDQRKTLKEKEKEFSKKAHYITSVFNLIYHFYSLVQSRSCEIESDVTGVYLAQRAGYNPLGAIYLQEFLKEASPSPWIESFCTHPNAEKRKLAILSAITEIQPNRLIGRVEVQDPTVEKYESDSSQCKLREFLKNNF